MRKYKYRETLLNRVIQNIFPKKTSVYHNILRAPFVLFYIILGIPFAILFDFCVIIFLEGQE